VAVTFDDIPGYQGDNCDVAAYRALNEKLVAAIKRNAIPALGLVNEGHLCEAERHHNREIYEVWYEAGLELGNHTFSHRDFNVVPLEEFKADIIAGERSLTNPRYFRFPFLRTGLDLEKKRAIERFLDERGYRQAVVTFDNDEYIYAAAYAAAQRKGDRVTAGKIAGDYLRYMESTFVFYEQLARETLGYEPPQILLLHANALNADSLDRLAGILRSRGYRFDSIENVLKDPVYARRDDYIGRRGLSWLQRWAIGMGNDPKKQPDVPAWVMDLYRAR
jgi:peptidoglycan/xylan/chitin deacetylase (PgdA/CDA1 family)